MVLTLLCMYIFPASRHSGAWNRPEGVLQVSGVGHFGGARLKVYSRNINIKAGNTSIFGAWMNEFSAP